MKSPIIMRQVFLERIDLKIRVSTNLRHLPHMEESTSLIKESLIERQFKDQEYSSQHKMFNTEREICYQA
jgi:hypothetical protein